MYVLYNNQHYTIRLASGTYGVLHFGLSEAMMDKLEEASATLGVNTTIRLYETDITAYPGAWRGIFLRHACAQGDS